MRHTIFVKLMKGGKLRCLLLRWIFFQKSSVIVSEAKKKEKRSAILLLSLSHTHIEQRYLAQAVHAQA
jgi:hypothetical protein